MRSIALLFALAPAFAGLARAQTPTWRLAGERAVGATRPLESERSFSLASEHPALGATLHFDARGQDLELELFRRGVAVWRKPAPSESVFIPPGADLVVFVLHGELRGTIGEGPRIASGLIAWNEAGEVAADLGDLGAIECLHLFRDGRALLYAGGALRLVDLTDRGAERWSFEAALDDLQVFEGERFFRVGRTDVARSSYACELRDVAGGRALLGAAGSIAERAFVLGVSSDGGHAFVRRTRGLQPLVCDLEVHELASGQMRVIRDLRGGPIAVDRDAATGALALSLYRPGEEGESARVRLELLDGAGERVFVHDCGAAPFDAHRGRVGFEDAGARVVVRNGSTEQTFVREEVK